MSDRPGIPSERLAAWEELVAQDPGAVELATLIDPWAMKPYNGGIPGFTGAQREAMLTARRLLDAGWRKAK